MTTQDEVKDKKLFQSRSSRRAERLDGAQIGRSVVSKAPSEKKSPLKEPFKHQHQHVLKITSSNPDGVRYAQYENALKQKTSLINMFQKLGKDVSMKKEFDDLVEQNFNLMLEFDRFNQSLLDKHQTKENPPTLEEDLTVSTMDVNTFVHQFSDSEDDEENLLTSFVPKNIQPDSPDEEDVPTTHVPTIDLTTPDVPTIDLKTPDVPTQLDVNMRTTSSDLITDYTGESMKIQGPIRGKKFKKVVIPSAKVSTTQQDVKAFSPSFECYIRGCKNDAYDKCIIIGCLCNNVPEFCLEHLDYVKHQKLMYN